MTPAPQARVQKPPTPPRPFQRRREGPGNASRPLEVPRKPDPILFQQWFKSVNPQRTYAAQVKRAQNGNEYVVLTEGKRDKQTAELKKISLYLYGEDFDAFLKLMDGLAQWIRAHPMPADLKRRRASFWEKQTASKLDSKGSGSKVGVGSLPRVPAPPAAKTFPRSTGR